jgi:hypothetical protein
LEGEGKKTLGQPDTRVWLKEMFTDEQVFYID